MNSGFSPQTDQPQGESANVLTLERRLSELTHHDKPLVVCRDASLTDSSDREQFYEKLFASFRRNRHGNIEVRGGRASENGVFLQDDVSRALIQVCHPVNLKSGRRVILAKKVSFHIPGNEKPVGKSIAEDKLYELSPGKRCVLGRGDLTPINNEVSSKHLTVIRLQDNKGERVYRVIDGIHPDPDTAGEDFPLVDDSSQGWIEVPDWHPVRTGRVVRLGQSGPRVRIPLWRRNPLSNAGEEYFHQDTCMRMRKHYFSFPLPIPAVTKIPPARHATLEFLQNELETIFQLINEGRIELAHARLLSTSAFSSLGMKNIIDDGHAEFRPTDDQVKDAQTIQDLFLQLSPRIEAHSEPDLLRIITGKVLSDDPAPPGRLKHRQSKQTFLWMISLFECEQWCFTYQNIAGTLISRRGELITGFQNARKLDTALFMEENGCPLSDDYLSLYQRRDLQRILNAAHEFEEVQVTALALIQALFELEAGRGLTLKQDDPYFENAPKFPKPIAEEFQNFKIVLERLYSGFYRVKQSDGTTTLKLYAPDSGGIWSEITDHKELTPGTPLRLGRFLEIMLP